MKATYSSGRCCSPDQVRLCGVEGDAVGDGLQQGHLDVDVGRGPAAASAGRLEQERLVGQDGGGRVEPAAGDLVHADPVAAAQ